MGLKETIQQAVNSGFGALGNVRESVTLKVMNNPGYTPSSQTITETFVGYVVVGVFARYKQREIDGETIKPNDMKFLFPQLGITFMPSTIDRLARTNGEEWNVIDLSKDPADAVWVLQIRRPA